MTLQSSISFFVKIILASLPVAGPYLFLSLVPASLALDLNLECQHFNPSLAALSWQHILLISG